MCSLHIVMNLPAMAIEFLDTFEGLLSDAEPGCKSEDIEKVPIWVHVYGFSNEDDKVRKNIQCLSDRMTMFGRDKKHHETRMSQHPRGCLHIQGDKSTRGHRLC